MDFSRTKPSKNFQDYTNLLYKLLSPWEPESDVGLGFPTELRTNKHFLDMLRNNMTNEFWNNFLLEGGSRPHKNFDFHQEDFDTHSNLRKKNQEYDKY